ncbi:hypothetical protein D3C81_1697500 [compost metagenome]
MEGEERHATRNAELDDAPRQVHGHLEQFEMSQESRHQDPLGVHRPMRQRVQRTVRILGLNVFQFVPELFVFFRLHPVHLFEGCVMRG